MFGIIENADKESEVTVFTLSKEEAEGKTYTDRTTIDDSDMWETEQINHTTEISEITTEEVTYPIIEFPLDINLANVDELVQIDGIGSVTAEKIVEYRNKYGYFYDYNELLNIDGIGEKKLSNLKQYIYISDEFLEITETQVPKITEMNTITTVSAKETTRATETIPVTVATTEEFEIINEEFVIDGEENFDYEEIYSNDFEYETTEFSVTHYVSFPIELNTATVQDLICIDGIGETTANKIVAYANNYGFYTVDDLLNVDGIGKSKLESIAPYVYVNTSILPEKTETEVDVQETYVTELITDPIVETSIPRVNINTCGVSELIQLPGIDMTIAENILAFRNARGGFYKIEEIGLADGMTNDKLAAIWDYIYM